MTSVGMPATLDQPKQAVPGRHERAFHIQLYGPEAEHRARSHSHCHTSTFNPGTWEKCLSLFVTTAYPPRPRGKQSANPYSRSASHSFPKRREWIPTTCVQSRTASRSRNSCTSEISAGLPAFSAPNCNSAAVMTDTHTRSACFSNPPGEMQGAPLPPKPPY